MFPVRVATASANRGKGVTRRFTLSPSLRPAGFPPQAPRRSGARIVRRRAPGRRRTRYIEPSTVSVPSTDSSRPINRGPRFRVGASTTLRGPQIQVRGKAAAQREQILLQNSNPISTEGVRQRLTVLSSSAAGRCPASSFCHTQLARSQARRGAATVLCQAPTLGKGQKRKKERDRDRPLVGSPRINGPWAIPGENRPQLTPMHASQSAARLPRAQGPPSQIRDGTPASEPWHPGHKHPYSGCLAVKSHTSRMQGMGAGFPRMLENRAVGKL